MDLARLSTATAKLLKTSIWLTIAILFLGLTSGRISAAGETAVDHSGILIVKSRDSAFYTPALDGFISGLKKRGVDDVGASEVKVISLVGDETRDQKSVSGQVLKNYRLIVTLGTDATRAVAEDHPVGPCLFSMILDPLSLGIASSLAQPGGAFTGTTLLVSPGKQLDALQQIDPKVRRIGLVYTDRDPTSLAFIAAATNDANRLGLQVIAAPVGAGSESRNALDRLSGQVDAIWLIVDPASAGPQALIDTFDVAKAHHLPVLGTSSANVRDGALVALSANLQDLGDLDAEMAVPLLNGRSTSASTAIEGPRQTVLSINLDAAKALGLTVPGSVLQLADEVVASNASKEGGT